MTTAKAKANGQADLGAEERRRRVREVREAGKRLEMVEKKLLHAQAEVSGMVTEVQEARAVIDRNTLAPEGEGE